MLSKSVAAITIGAIVGGVIGLILGIVLRADNPFVYTSMGIAIGAAISVPFFVREK